MTLQITKTLAAMTFTALFVAPALAVVPQPGDFVAKECGAAHVAGQATDPVTKVCFGQTATTDGKPQAGASIALASGQVKNFAVASRFMLANEFESGATQTVLRLQAADGQTTSMKITRSHDDQILSVTGVLADQHYTAGSFQPVMVIQ